jgi:DNA helicase HerA-like ATPase
VIGVAAGGRPVGVDLDSESPHTAVSAGTGAGKSNMLRVVAAQVMHHGAALGDC